MSKHTKQWLKPFILTLVALAAVVFLLGSTLVGIGGATPSPGETIKAVPQIEIAYWGLPVGAKLWIDDEPLPVEVRLASFKLVGRVRQMPEGKHRLRLQMKTVLRTIEQGWDFTVDATAPKLQVLTPAQGTALTAERVSIRGKTEPNAIVTLNTPDGKQLERLPADAEGSFTTEMALAAGWNEAVLVSTDAAGNPATKGVKVFGDREAPTARLKLLEGDAQEDEEEPAQNADGATLKKNKGALIVDASDDGGLADCQVFLDGNKPRRLAVPASQDGKIKLTMPFQDLFEGDRHVVCQLTDRAGRVNNVTASFNVDSSEKFGERTMTRGARGEDVKQLQQRLVDLKLLDKDQITLVFDEATEDAVTKFQIDQKLKADGVVGRGTLVALGPRIIVNLSNFSLVLDRPGKPLRRYGIACGMPEWPTPTGEFTIVEKVMHPTWLPPDSAWAREAKAIPPGPGNPLGTRWIGLDSGVVGIHGTNAEWTIGSAASHGCLRMRIADVEELYELITEGTPVSIMSGYEKDERIKKYWP